MNAHGNYTLNNDTALKEQIANQSLAAMWIAYTEQKITFTEQVWLTWLNVLNSYNYFIFRCTCLHTSDNQMRTSDVQGHYAPVMSYTHDWPLITLYTYIHIHSLASRSLSLSPSWIDPPLCALSPFPSFVPILCRRIGFALAVPRHYA